MRIVIASVGRPRALAGPIREYETRAARYWPLEVREVREVSARSFDVEAVRALRDAGQRIVVMTTTEKLGTREPHRIAAVGEIGKFVLESDVPADAMDALVQAGASILQAAPLS